MQVTFLGTGTSTGGIIALGLGAGLTARSLLDLYLHEGHRVFPPRQRARSRGIFRRFLRNRYDRSDLDELLQQALDSNTLRDSKYRLLIPATEAKHGDPCVFKTPTTLVTSWTATSRCGKWRRPPRRLPPI